MRCIGMIAIWFMASLPLHTLVAQTFPCDGRLTIATQRNGATVLAYRTAIPFGPEFFSPWVSYPNAKFDALGFNPKDNYVYGVQENTNAVVRLRRDRTYDTVGVVPFVDTLRVFAGDCTPEGLYICHDSQLDQILVFDVVDNFKLVNRIDLYWDPSSSFSGKFSAQIFDLAINPNNPLEAYSYLGNYEHPNLVPIEARGYLLRINLDFSDPNLGMVTPVGILDKDAIAHLGGLLFAPGGALFGYGASPWASGLQQDRFISINPFAADISVFNNSINPITSVSDGLTCPYSFTFFNNVPLDGIFCGGDEKDFVLTIFNNSFNDFSNLTLTDTFPEGMIIKKVSGNYEGTIEPGTGVGSKHLMITGLNIGRRTRLDITIKVGTTDIEVGTTTNQAFLSNLPEEHGEVLVSDNPGTVGLLGDPSLFHVIPYTLENVSWNVTPPSDCINGNDAQIRLSSPDFLVGKEYQIKLRNKIGWEETTYNLTADNNKTLLMDSLIRGDYQLFDFKSLDEKCSFSLRDTTIFIDPPNEQLEVIAQSNSPICEGEVLQFNATLSPQGHIAWTGPALFASAEINPSRQITRTNQSGTYKLEMEYGFCEKVDTIDVYVAPKTKAAIAGKTEYCERELLELTANGEGENLRFKWSRPNGWTSEKSVIVLPGITSRDEGYYEVIVDNGGCQDTSGVNVTVLPTPSVALPDLIVTDYCDPIRLRPELTGDTDVQYSWQPAEGLSCADCASPELLPLVQSNYRLKVVNDFNCTDSADMRIILDKKDLLTQPNTFRPNSQKGNSHFALYPHCVINTIRKFVVFNRWGAEVFSKSNLSPLDRFSFWDGYVDGKLGNPGVYIWTAEIELVDGSIQILNGNITLIN